MLTEYSDFTKGVLFDILHYLPPGKCPLMVTLLQHSLSTIWSYVYSISTIQVKDNKSSCSIFVARWFRVRVNCSTTCSIHNQLRVYFPVLPISIWAVDLFALHCNRPQNGVYPGGWDCEDASVVVVCVSFINENTVVHEGVCRTSSLGIETTGYASGKCSMLLYVCDGTRGWRK